MTAFPDRYQRVKQVGLTDLNLKLGETTTTIVLPYVRWQLVEHNTITSDVLICRPLIKLDQAAEEDLLILRGALGRVWITMEQSAKRSKRVSTKRRLRSGIP
jgi:hypothetical protein